MDGMIEKGLSSRIESMPVRKQRRCVTHIRDLGVVLTRQSADRQAVKLGLVLLSLSAGELTEVDYDLCLKLGKCEEFTAYAARVFFQTVQNPDAFLIELCASTDGFGRIFVVNLLCQLGTGDGDTPLSNDVREFLLIEGWFNTVYPALTAYSVCIACDLPAVLESLVLDESKDGIHSQLESSDAESSSSLGDVSDSDENSSDERDGFLPDSLQEGEIDLKTTKISAHRVEDELFGIIARIASVLCSESEKQQKNDRKDHFGVLALPVDLRMELIGRLLETFVSYAPGFSPEMWRSLGPFTSTSKSSEPILDSTVIEAILTVCEFSSSHTSDICGVSSPTEEPLSSDIDDESYVLTTDNLTSLCTQTRDMISNHCSESGC